ncbi:MAG: TetR/AcrR family transcriptional regulator [Thermodesulfobacteriota bacterium]
MSRRSGKGSGKSSRGGRGASPSPGEEGRLRAILDEGLRAFARKGFSQTPVAEVAAAAGVASGTIIYHFLTKENLLAVLTWECLNLLYRRCSQAASAADPGPARVRAYVDAYFGLLREEPDRLLLLFKTSPMELSEAHAAPGLDIRTLWQSGRILLADIFRESQAASPADGNDPERMAASLLAHLSGAAWLHLFFGEDLEEMHASARDVVQAFFSGSSQT